MLDKGLNAGDDVVMLQNRCVWTPNVRYNVCCPIQETTKGQSLPSGDLKLLSACNFREGGFPRSWGVLCP